MKDYCSIINLLVSGEDEIVGCTTINPITFEIRRFRGENSKGYLNSIPKNLINRYALMDSSTGVLIKDSFTVVSKTYGYITICNGNTSKVYTLKESELIKNRVNMNMKFTNIDFIKRADNKGESIQRNYGTTPDISTLLYSGMLDDQLEAVKYHMEKTVELRIEVIQNIDIQTFGVKSDTINNLVSNRNSLIETLSTFTSLRKDILEKVYKKQRVNNYILETLDMQSIINKCKEDF